MSDNEIDGAITPASGQDVEPTATETKAPIEVEDLGEDRAAEDVVKQPVPPVDDQPERPMAAHMGSKTEIKSGLSEISIEKIEVERKKPEPMPASNPLNTEFMYYSSLLKILAGGMSDVCLRKKAAPWIRKLFGPEYNSKQFKEKRNKYMCSLCLCLINEDMVGVFANPPPDGALVDVGNVEIAPTPPAGWETSPQWQENIEGVIGMGEIFSVVECGIHPKDDEGKSTCYQKLAIETSNMLDDEFRLFMYMARPFATLMTSSEDKTRAAAWMQFLSLVDALACPVLKGTRNDYMQALLGYVSDLRLAGPFQDYPQWGQLISLEEAAKFASLKRPFTDPASNDAEEFMKMQTLPRTGAFAYIAVTGELLASSLPMKQPPPPPEVKFSKSPRTSLNLQPKPAHKGIKFTSTPI